MFSEHNKLFTIGQFSAIHGVTKKTLMWYDEIGLLSLLSLERMGIATTPTFKARHWK